MNGSPQPALLYIVPSLIIPLFLLSVVRKESSLFWNGPLNEEQSEMKTNENDQN